MIIPLLGVATFDTDGHLLCSNWEVHQRQKLVVPWITNTLQNLSIQCWKNIHNRWERNP